MLQGPNDTRHVKVLRNAGRWLCHYPVPGIVRGLEERLARQEAELLLLTPLMLPGLSLPLTMGRLLEFSKPQSSHLSTGDKTCQVWKALTVPS